MDCLYDLKLFLSQELPIILMTEKGVGNLENEPFSHIRLYLSITEYLDVASLDIIICWTGGKVIDKENEEFCQ